MAKQGDSFHRVVHAIETVIANTPNVTIEAPKRLRDKDTGKLREHDIVLTFTHAHHSLLMAIECRDRSRSIGVPDVEAFHSKCLRTGIDRGIMVSPKGFAKTAIIKAASYNIGCLQLGEIEQFDWCQTPGVHVLNHDLLSAHLGIDFAEAPPDGWIAFQEDGSPVTQELIRGWALQFFNAHLRGTDLVGDITHSFVDTQPAIHTFDGNNQRIAATAVTLTATYRIERLFVPLDFRSYFDLAKNKSITEFAIAAIPLPGGARTNLVFNKEDDGSIKVSLVSMESGPRPQPKEEH